MSFEFPLSKKAKMYHSKTFNTDPEFALNIFRWTSKEKSQFHKRKRKSESPK